MDVSLIIKSRNVFPAPTGTFVYVFLVVTRENAKMKYSDWEVIFVPFYSDTDWLGKVDLFFLFVTALFSNRLFQKLIGKRFVAFIREFITKSLRRPLLRRSWMRCRGESTSCSSPNFKLDSCSLLSL